MFGPIHSNIEEYNLASGQQQAKTVTNTISASGQRELIDVTFELGKPVVPSNNGTPCLWITIPDRRDRDERTAARCHIRATRMIARPLASR